jgi:adenosylmethionine-8-amino-7-oxononanoate aminotransferase
MSLADRDRACLWHPYTQMQTAPAPLPIVRGEGAYLYTEDGRRILDGISS